MKKILFVCLGNICRSPLAEALFRKHVTERGLANEYLIDSCGTADYHVGHEPDSRSRANAKANGLEYTHKGRQVQLADFDDFDWIIPMDRSNKSDLERLQQGGSASISLMRDFDDQNTGADVPDPYYGGEQGFQNVFEILDRSTAALLDHIENR